MTGQNTSSAVMQQRREPHDSLDFFPTPLWATRAFVQHVLPQVWNTGALDHPYKQWTAADPACGEGHMVRALRESFGKVNGSDVNPYGKGFEVEDFLLRTGVVPYPVHMLVTNPPFRLAADFIWQAKQVAEFGAAFLVRTAFLEGQDRYQQLFSKDPPFLVAQYVERVPMIKGRVCPKASTATAYCWLVWKYLHVEPWDRHTRFFWIPPCRKRLEKPGDWE